MDANRQKTQDLLSFGAYNIWLKSNMAGINASDMVLRVAEHDATQAKLDSDATLLNAKLDSDMVLSIAEHDATQTKIDSDVTIILSDIAGVSGGAGGSDWTTGQRTTILSDLAKATSDLVLIEAKLDSDSLALGTKLDSDSTLVTGKLDSDAVITLSDIAALSTKADSDAVLLTGKLDSDALLVYTSAKADSDMVVLIAEHDATQTKLDSDSNALGTKLDSDSTLITGKADVIDTLLDKLAPRFIGTLSGAGTGTEICVYGGVTVTYTVDGSGNISNVVFS
jgi:hypothetical protein